MTMRVVGWLSQRGLAVWLAAVVLSFSAAAAYSVHAAMPFNPLALPEEDDVAARSWLPQGWRFFTRDPREDQTLLYRLDEGRWVSASLGPNFRLRNYLGLSRVGRSQAMEMAMLIWGLSKNTWHKCEEASSSCLSAYESPLKVTNKSPVPSLCGPIGIVLQEQIPWAWAGDHSDVIMPSRVLRLDVQC